MVETAVISSNLHNTTDQPIMRTGQTTIAEYRFQLAKRLSNVKSHFNTQIDRDPSRLSYVYNELLFKMDTLPSFLKPMVLNLVGFIECSLGRSKTGMKCFTAVRKMDEGNVVCLGNLAHLALRDSQFSVVESLLELMRKPQSQERESLTAAELGHLYQWFGLNNAALHEYQRAMSLDDRNWAAVYGKAIVMYELSKHESRVCGFKYLTSSLELFRRLLGAFPDMTLARIYEGKARNQLVTMVMPDSESDEQTDRIFTQVMSTDCAPEILCMIGEEYLRMGVLEGEPCAMSIFSRALEKRKNSRVYHLLGMAMRATYFRHNPDMLHIYKQGLFMKQQTCLNLNIPATTDPSKGRKQSIAKKVKMPAKQPSVTTVLETADPLEGVVSAELQEEEGPAPPAPPAPVIDLNTVIETFSTAVKLSRGANREAVFDLAEILWLAGEKTKAVTNFELATQSENVIIQVKAHLRLAQAFLDNHDLKQAEYHLGIVMKLEAMSKEEDDPLRERYRKILREIALRFIRQNKPKKAVQWVHVNLKEKTEASRELLLHLIYTRFY